MLKKYFISLTLVSFFHANILYSQKITVPQPAFSAAISKDQKFILLNKIAEHINRLAPLDEYTVTVPPFFVLTERDIHQLLATIPYQQNTLQPLKQKKRSQSPEPMSVLDLLEQTWKMVRASLKHGKATAKTYQLLSNVRDTIDTAFNTEHIAFGNQAFLHFLTKAKNNNMPLIVRMTTDQPTLGPKSIYPVEATSVYRAIGDTLKTYYQDITIDQLLTQGSLPSSFYGTVILQQFITQDNTDQPLVSGFSCSHDHISGAPSISVIEAVFGHHAGFKHTMVVPDTYYIYSDTVIPVIRKKEYRLDPNMEGVYTSVTKNNDIIAQTATLDAHAAHELAKTTLLLAKSSNTPVCISFIKQNNTIYLIDFHYVPEVNITQGTYIDPLYIKKAIKDGAIHAVSLKPLHHVIAIKKPQQILFASDIFNLLEQYEKSSDRDEITVGILEHKPSPWSKEQKILENLPFVTLWSSCSDNIKKWVDLRSWPLVIDPQTQLMFPYKRRKNFCTLFQTITPGLNRYPLPENLSVIESFSAPLSLAQKDLLRPNEFFSGVSMGYLFNLLKSEQPETALQALRTILYRLQTRIKRTSEITTQKDLEKQYEHIMTISYKLYTMMQHTLKTHRQQSANDQKLLFLIDVLQKLITQTPSDTTVNAISFNTLLKQTR